ncbi:hypothetical protein VIGAN_02189300, partial [Vigna angularis var. angularis]
SQSDFHFFPPNFSSLSSSLSFPIIHHYHRTTLPLFFTLHHPLFTQPFTLHQSFIRCLTRAFLSSPLSKALVASPSSKALASSPSSR